MAWQFDGQLGAWNGESLGSPYSTTVDARAAVAATSDSVAARANAIRSLFTIGTQHAPTRVVAVRRLQVHPSLRALLLVAVGDATPVEGVRRELDLHAVAGQDAGVVAAHLARDVAENLVIVLELHAEHRVGER